jgi:hypothetical protein
LRERRGVGARQPFEEHGPLVVGEQADEGELGARRVVEHDRAVAAEDRGHDLVAEFARVALDGQRLVALDHDVLAAGSLARHFALGVGAARFDRRPVVLRVNRKGGQRPQHSHY